MSRWNLLTAVLTITQVLIAQAPHAAAMVMDLSGKASLGEGVSAEPLTITTEVPSGRHLRLEAGSRVVLVSFKTGEEITVKGPASFNLDTEGRPVGLKQGVQRTLAQGLQLKQVLKPGGLAQASVVMRAPAGDFTLVAPSSRVVRSRTPTFRWQGAGESARYVLILGNPDGTERYRTETASTQVALPVQNALAEGSTYVWTVQASLPDGTGKEVRGEVEVLGATQRHELAGLRSKRTRSFAYHVAYAVALQCAGLSEEARAEWKTLSQQRPNDPGLKAYAN